MPRSSRVVLVLHSDPGLLASVRAAAVPPAIVSRVATWADLAASLKEAPPSTVAIVDPYWGAAGCGPAEELRQLLQHTPSASLLAALEVTEHRARDLVALDEWGAAG